jgi:competence protein ComEC
LISLLSFLSGVPLYYLFQYFPCLTVLVSVAASVFLLLKGRAAALVLLLLGILYPLAHASLGGGETGIHAGTQVLSGYFQSPAVRRTGGHSQEFRVFSPGGGGRTLDVLSGMEFEMGRELELEARVVEPGQRLNPGGRDRSPYALLEDVRSTGGLVRSTRVSVNRVREILNGHVRERYTPEAAALIMAVTTGSREGFAPELKASFRAAGLAHLLSISGTHFGLFAVLVFGLLRTMIKYLPMPVLQRVTLYVTPSTGAAVLTLPFMLGYLGLSGARIPSVRAFIMIGLFLLGLLAGRKGHWLNFLLLAAVALVLWEPTVVFSLSFQLSFTAVLFIGFFMRECTVFGNARFTDEAGNADLREPSGALGDIREKRGLWGMAKSVLEKGLWRPVLISLSASLGVAPLVAYCFHYFSVISPLANLVVTPLVGFLLVPFSLLAASIYLLTGASFIAPLLEAVSGLSVFLVRWFASVPYSSVKVSPFPLVLLAAFYLGFLLFWISGRKRLKMLSLVLCFLPAFLFAAPLAVSERPLALTFLDSGSADSSVVELPDGKVLVVDAGGSGRETEAYLRYRGVRTVDALVLTHGHADHTGGARRLLESFEVGEIWDNGRLRYPEGFLKDTVARRKLQRGDLIEGEGYRITVLHPYGGFYTEGGRLNAALNNDSLVLKLYCGGHSFLFAGDIEAEAIEDMLSLGLAGDGMALRSDLMKVPHHGLKSSYREEFLDMVSPAYAVVNSDRISPELRAALGEGRLMLTGRDGALRVRPGRNGLRIKTFGESMIKRTRNVGGELRNIRGLFEVW